MFSVSRKSSKDLPVRLHLYYFACNCVFQIERFNALLGIIKSSLIDLEKGIKGLVVMSSDLEETFHCIYDARVPPLWGKVSSVTVYTLDTVFG